MNIIDAVHKASDFVFEQLHVRGYPDTAILHRHKQSNYEWRLLFHFSLFHPELAERCGVVDGGERIVVIDDSTGETRFSEIP